MRFLVLATALLGLVAFTGCTNTATGFGRDLEKSGQAIQKTVSPKAKTTASNNNAGSNAGYNSATGYAPQPAQQQEAAPTPLYNNEGSGNNTYTPTPSGY